MALPTPNGTEALDAEGSEGVRETETTTTTGEPPMSDSVTITCDLTKFSQELDCYVLNPAAFPNIINAFHPDYVKTYHPELLSSIKAEETQKANGLKVAKTTPMKMHPIRPAHLHRPNLAPTDFHVYQKAGMPKGKKK